MGKVCTVAEDTGNTKLSGRGRVAATYASIDATCGPCPLKGDGCYAQAGRVAFTVRRLDAAASERNVTPEQAATEERAAIGGTFGGGPVPRDGERGGRDLRLHVSGDAATSGAARQLGRAAQEWKARGGGEVWTYTHAWRAVSRWYWGPAVSVLASCESPADADAARRQGYTPAVIVAEFPAASGPFTLPGSGIKWLACREQAEGVPCSQCRLCMAGDRMARKGLGIAFQAHGSVAKVKRHLPVLGGVS